MSADRNLLFGILALQMDFISRDALIQAMHAWVLDKGKPLGQILVEQGALDANNQVLLDTLVKRHLALHGDNPAHSLAAISPSRWIRAELEKIADRDLHASLVHCTGTPPRIGDPFATKDSSVGILSSTGTRFRVVRAHAKGGLGEVFVAVDEELRREVALKEIQPQYAHHTESRTRFVREAEITGGLEHPGVVPVYGKGEYGDGRPFYVMRFIRGNNLKAAIDRFHQAEGLQRDPGERTLELRQLLSRFVAVCNTVAYAHSRGVIHRDLKPANVMLGNYGETLVVDWGLAKLIDQPEATDGLGEPGLATLAGGDSDLTRAGQTLGTPAYMSPEQAAGRLELLGPASDVYSLGATLYCLLTGKAPFSDSDVGVMLANVQLGEFPPPRQHNPQVPRALEAICLKAMSLHPTNRYGSAKALADDIENWLADETVTAYEEPWRARLGRWVRRHKALVGSAVATCALAITITVAWWLVTAALARETHEQYLRGLAEEQKGVADEQRQRAETKQMEADRQRVLAEEQRTEANKQRGLVQRLLYCSRIKMAEQAWHDNQFGRMKELLQDYYQPQPGQEDLRGFEWHYLRGRSCLLNLHAHTESVFKVAFSPDGRRLTSFSNGEMRVWDATTGQVVLLLKGYTFVFSPDGRRLAGGPINEPVKVWDITTGQETLTLRGSNVGFIVAFSPDGLRLVSVGGGGFGNPGEIKVWDATTGQETLSLNAHKAYVNSLAFSPDSRRLVSAGGILGKPDEIKVWDATTGQELLTLNGDSGYVMSVAFSPDGRRLATAWNNATVKVRDLRTGQETHSFKGNFLAFSPDGRRLACAPGEGTVKVWDATTGQEEFSLKGHTSFVLGAAFSPDGHRLATYALDKTVKVWDGRTGQELFTLKGDSGDVKSVAFSPDSRRLATASNDLTVKVWDTTMGQDSINLLGHTGGVTSVAFSPDGRRLASASFREVRVWDTISGNNVLAIKGNVGGIHSVAFSVDGRLLASASFPEVKVWEAPTGQEVLSLKGHTGPVHSVAFSPDGRRLASASEDETVKVWDTTTGQETFTLKGHSHWVFEVSFSPDGSCLASASADGTVKIWDMTTGQEALTLKGHTGTVHSLSFSPDGRRLASASFDWTVKVWDTTTGQETFSLRGHTAGVTSVAFSPDGRSLASASEDQTVKVWDVTTGQETLNLKGHTQAVTSVAFSPDSRRLASASNDRTIKVWEAITPTPEVILRREATSLVDFLYLKMIQKILVIQHLRGDPLLSDAIRKEALAQAEQYRPDARKLNHASWQVVRQPGAQATAYGQALAQAQEACRLVPDNGSYLNTLGVAYYRTGNYQQALETLTRSDKFNNSTVRIANFLHMGRQAWRVSIKNRQQLARGSTHI